MRHVPLTGWLVITAAVLAVAPIAPSAATAEMKLPPGFTARVYVTGEGFDAAAGRGARGIPASSTLAFDHSGVLYLARTGRRYTPGDVEDVWPIFRIPVGGARLTPATETQFFHGPPLPNPQIAGVRDGRELYVTTFDRDRKIGVVYRVVDGRAELFAGGTPPRGTPPTLVQPEGVTFDGAGHVYVADRERGAVVRLDPAARVLDARYAALPRPRVLAMGEDGELWVGCDGAAEAPWQPGQGEIWKIPAPGTSEPQLLLRGPIPAAMGMAPGGHVFVADRQGARIFALKRDGTRLEFARFADGDTPRSLVFAPVSDATRRSGIAGDLFVVTIAGGAWPVNEVIRVSGPFERFLTDGPAPAW